MNETQAKQVVMLMGFNSGAHRKLVEFADKEAEAPGNPQVERALRRAAEHLEDAHFILNRALQLHTAGPTDLELDATLASIQDMSRDPEATARVDAAIARVDEIEEKK